MIITQLSPQVNTPLKKTDEMTALEDQPKELKTPVVPVMRGQE